MKTVTPWGFPSFENLTPAEALTAAITRIYRRQLTTPSGGNLSMRMPDGSTWLTPASNDKGSLTSDQMACLRADGSQASVCRPTSEAPFHLSVYRCRADLKAVVHAHPVSLVAASICGVTPERGLFPMVDAVCPQQGMAPYALPGSQALGESVAGVFAKGIDTVFLENHGIVVGGETLTAAMGRFEVIEHIVDMDLAARGILGKRVPIHGGQEPVFELCNPSGSLDPLPEEASLRQTLANFIRRGYTQRLIWPMFYSFSIRAPGGDGFLIQPDVSDPASLQPDLCVRVDAKSLRYTGNHPPHKWAALHAGLYRKLPECNAIFFSVPTVAGAFSLTGLPIDARTIPESYILLRDVQNLSSQWWHDGGKTLVDSAQMRRPVALLGQAGAAVIGRSAFAAFDTMEVLENTARSLKEAHALGGLRPMGEVEILDIIKAFKLEP